MNREAQKLAAGATPPVVFDLRERVPQMADDALTTLNANALRLKESGSALQRNAATDLLPVIEAEIARRRAHKIANAPPRAPRATKKKPPTAKAKKAAPESE